MEKKNPSTKAGAGRDHRHFADNSTQAQRARLLDVLRISPISTLEARRNHDIMHPAMRIHELRHKFGYNIVMFWSVEPSDRGKLHRVARYVLKSEVRK